MYQVSLVDIPGKPNISVIYLGGEVDGESVDEFKSEVENALSDPNNTTTHFILHIRDLEFINSLVIGYFADLYTRLGQSGKKLILSEGNPHILDILGLVGFMNLVEHYDNLKEAIASTEI